jgi:hypothetical protein
VVHFDFMAPRKSTPLSIAQIKHTTGITFSFRLIPLSDSVYLCKGFELEPAVHTISSLSLVRRMNIFKEKKVKKSSPIAQKKRRPGTTSSVIGECVWCGVHKTAQWRRGPNGARSLCNVFSINIALWYRMGKASQTRS